MSWTLVLPAIAAVILGVCGGFVQRHLRPQAAVPILTCLAVLVSVATTGALLLLAVGYLAQMPWVVQHAGWCATLARSHDAVPAPVGLGASAGLVAMIATTTVRARRRRSTVAGLAYDGPLQVLPSDERLAFAVPGRPGHIVVSTGMLHLLNPSERRVLFAHETSHLRHRHHRYLAVTDLAAAAIPVLRPLCAHLRYATERWADEDAADAVGDRRLVAQAIARAALGRDSAHPLVGLHLAQLPLSARVESLLAERPSSRAVAVVLGAAVLGLVAAAVTSTIQLQEFLSFAVHVCRNCSAP